MSSSATLSTLLANESNFATMLAALRLFQKTFEGVDGATIAAQFPDHFTRNDGSLLPPLGTEDIHTFCEALNAAAGNVQPLADLFSDDEQVYLIAAVDGLLERKRKAVDLEPSVLGKEMLAETQQQIEALFHRLNEAFHYEPATVDLSLPAHEPLCPAVDGLGCRCGEPLVQCRACSVRSLNVEPRACACGGTEFDAVEERSNA